jgi:hypothetical protein
MEEEGKVAAMQLETLLESRLWWVGDSERDIESERMSEDKEKGGHSGI